jgi:hypothetical protein
MSSERYVSKLIRDYSLQENKIRSCDETNAETRGKIMRLFPIQ